MHIHKLKKVFIMINFKKKYLIKNMDFHINFIKYYDKYVNKMN